MIIIGSWKVKLDFRVLAPFSKNAKKLYIKKNPKKNSKSSLKNTKIQKLQEMSKVGKSHKKSLFPKKSEIF